MIKSNKRHTEISEAVMLIKLSGWMLVVCSPAFIIALFA